MEDDNVFSRNAIAIFSRLDEKIVSEQLATKLKPLWRDGCITEITGKITGEARSATEGTWNQGGGIEVSCIYNIVGKKKHKIKVRNTLKKNRITVFFIVLVFCPSYDLYSLRKEKNRALELKLRI